MKLNSTMKHRRLKSRLLISMLTVALRFSYLLISKDNVLKAEGVDSIGIRTAGSYYYGTWCSVRHNIDANYNKPRTNPTATVNDVNTSTSHYRTHFEITFYNFGCYNGRLQIDLYQGSFGLNDYIQCEGARLYEVDIARYSELSQANRSVIVIEFNGEKERHLHIYTQLDVDSTIGVDNIDVLGNWTQHGNSVAENLDNIYNFWANDNAYKTVINGIKSDTNSMLTKMDTLHTDLQTINNTLQGMQPSSSQTEIINNFDTNLDIVNDIEINLLTDINDEDVREEILTVFGDDLTSSFEAMESTVYFLNNVVYQYVGKYIEVFMMSGAFILLALALLG